MKYKEFIQAVDSLTNDALLSNKEATPWKVDIDDESIEVINQKTNQPLLTIDKTVYGFMRVYQLTDPTAVAIYEKAVLLNKTPIKERVEDNINNIFDYTLDLLNKRLLKERDEVNTNNPLDDAIHFLDEVGKQLSRWSKQNRDYPEQEYGTFYFVGFKLRVSDRFLTVDGPHLQGSLSVDCNSMYNFTDKIHNLVHMAYLFKNVLLRCKDTINSALSVLDDQEDDSTLQFSTGRIIINKKHIIISTSSDAYFMWTIKPTYFGSQKKFHETLDD